MKTLLSFLIILVFLIYPGCSNGSNDPVIAFEPGIAQPDNVISSKDSSGHELQGVYTVIFDTVFSHVGGIV